ncbi:beta-1,3-galactosyltransferase 2-like [Lithobates pipiens]
MAFNPMGQRRVMRIYRCLVFTIMFASGYLYLKNEEWFVNRLMVFRELLSDQKIPPPINNLTYPGFKHPLAPPYPYPYKFLINQEKKCNDRYPFLVIMVTGRLDDIDSRHAIRETWGNESNYDVDVVRIFLVGLPKIFVKRTQRMLEEESEAFGDIVQQDFMDTYYNLTLKTLMGIEWVAKFCPTTSYVLKIDDDLFLNVDYLVHQLLCPELPVRTNYFTGQILKDTGPLRDKNYKWYVPKEVYPNDTYPPYCIGTGYVFSVDMVKKIYDISQVIRIIPIEDSFMGICLYELNISPIAPPPGIFNSHWIEYNHCRFKKLILVHHYKANELRKVWADFWTNKTSGC